MNKRSLLKKCVLFSDLGEEELDKIAEISFLKNYSKGEIIFLEGQLVRGFYIVGSGEIRLFKTSPDKREQVLRIARVGEVFAEAALFEGDTYPANSQTLTDSQILFVSKKHFIYLIKDHPEICFEMLGAMSRLLRKFNQLVEDLSLKEVSARLAKYILDQTAKSGQETPKGIKITLKIPKSQLASRLGTISETLSRTFRKMKEKKIIDINGNTLIILQPDFLHKISAGMKI